jgi:hypothetical protein
MNEQQEWIPITERTPAMAGGYRVKNEYAEAFGFYDDEGWFVFGQPIGYITHWQELRVCH